MGVRVNALVTHISLGDFSQRKQSYGLPDSEIGCRGRGVRAMRILMLTQYFQPEPVFKGLPLVKALRDRGHGVEVLTGFPNYPGGRVYDGYRLRPWRREVMDGIPVNRVAHYPSHDRSGVRRMLNYLSLGASAGVVGPWLVQKPDVIYAFSLITLGPAARWLRRLKGAKIVFDVQDLWPESVAGSGMLSNRLFLRILDRWCRLEYRKADRLVVLSPGFKRNLMARGIPEAKIDVVYNWCDEDSIAVPPRDPRLAEAWGFAGRFNVVFAGNLGRMQGLTRSSWRLGNWPTALRASCSRSSGTGWRWRGYESWPPGWPTFSSWHGSRCPRSARFLPRRMRCWCT